MGYPASRMPNSMVRGRPAQAPASPAEPGGESHAAIREKVPPLDHDRVLAPEIQASTELVRSGRLAAIGASAKPLVPV